MVAQNAKLIVVVDDLLRPGLITQVELVEDYYLLLLGLPDYGVELRIAS